MDTDMGVITGSHLERHRPYLAVLANAHLGANHQRRIAASDIVQETLAEAFELRQQFRGDEASLTAWLRKMLINNVADAFRAMYREKRDVRREKPLEAAIDDSFCRAESWLLAEQTSPSQDAARSEQLLAMSRAIAQLPDDQRQAVVLRYLSDWSLKDLAAHLGRSESAVAGLLYRGVGRLRQILQER